jgi:hypothetical protein
LDGCDSLREIVFEGPRGFQQFGSRLRRDGLRISFQS